MKKIISLLLLLTMVFTFAGCGETKKIEFPFQVSQVKNVVIYRYNVPTDAEKKILTESKDIENVISFFSGITIQNKKVEEHAKGTITSVEFNLLNGTNYHIIYVAEAIKSGTLMFTDDNTIWFTSADIGAVWNICDSDAVKAEVRELPSIK